MLHCNQPPFAEKATICKNIVYLLASAAIMIWMLEYSQIRSPFALDGLLLPRLPAGRGGWRAPCAAEPPTMLRTATGWTSTRSEPAVPGVQPSLGHRPVADSHARP